MLSLPAPPLVLIDIDNTVAPYGASVAEIELALDLWISHLSPIVSEIQFVSNAVHEGLVEPAGAVLSEHATKPFYSPKARSGDPIVVVGDQVLTDGLLAARLGATWIQLAITEGRAEPLWPRLLRALGRVVALFAFESAHPANPSKHSIESRRSLLISEYQAAREDDRSFAPTVAALASLAVVLYGGIIVLLIQTCPDHPAVDACKPEGNATPVSEWLYVVAPLGPLAVASYGILFTIPHLVRSYYGRAVERELWKHPSEVFTLQSDEGPNWELPMPSWLHINTNLASVSRAPPRIRALWLGTYLVGAGALIGGTVALLVRVPSETLRSLAFAFYGLVVLLLVSVVHFILASTHRGIWYPKILQVFSRPVKLRALGARATRHRKLVRVLLLPRPREIVKWAFIPGSALIALLASGDLSTAQWWHVAYVVVAFEAILYQGRYLINDLIDSETDDPNRVANERFPFHANPAAAQVATLTVVTRLFVFVGLAVFAPDTRLRVGLAWAGLLTVLTAISYEYLRRLTNSREEQSSSPRWTDRLVYSWVGTGYAIRVSLGIWIVDSFASSHASQVAAAAFGAALGSMFVTMSWALLGTKRLLATAQGTDMSMTHNQAHLMPLVYQNLRQPGIPAITERDPSRPCDVPVSRDEQKDPQNWRVLASPTRLRSWWDRAFVVSTALAVAMAFSWDADVLLSRPLSAVDLIWPLAIVGPALLLTLVHSAKSLLIPIVALAGSSPLLGWWFPTASWTAWGVVALPPTMAIGLYLFFRGATYREIAAPFKEWAQSLACLPLGLGAVLLRWLQKAGRKQGQPNTPG